MRWRERSREEKKVRQEREEERERDSRRLKVRAVVYLFPPKLNADGWEI